MMIRVKNLVKIYKGNGIETHALKGVNIDIEEGEYISILGKSGCGKSTLLNILGGMDRATSGLYTFLDRDVSRLNDRELANFRNQTIGFVFQAFHLIPELDLIDNISLPLGYAGVKRKERRERALSMLQKVGLEKEQNKRPPQLSGGQQQRVAIARALVHKPRLLLADEPTGNLDEETGKSIIGLLEQSHREGMTLILVTHDQELAARTDRKIWISDGMILS